MRPKYLREANDQDREVLRVDMNSESGPADQRHHCTYLPIRSTGLTTVPWAKSANAWLISANL